MELVGILLALALFTGNIPVMVMSTIILLALVWASKQ